MTPRLPAGPHALVVDGERRTSLTVARTHREKGRGLLGTDGVDGALWLEGTSSVHMMGMRYAIDVAVVDDAGVVVHVATLNRWTGLTWPRRGARATIEAEEGSMAKWGIQVGTHLAIG